MSKSLIILLIAFTGSLFAQNNTVQIQMPNMKMVVLGFDNIIEVNFDRKPIKNINLECQGCTEIRKVEDKNSTWIIRVDSIQPIVFIVRKKNGKILRQVEIEPISIPLPLLYIDGFDAQNIISSSPKLLTIKLHESVPIKIEFFLKSWKITINEQEYSGFGAEITKDVQEALKKSKKGMAKIEIVYLDIFGEQKLKEIIEFDIK